jgi:aminoglycoside phosphotransferase family enzyme/predicted kinase
MGTTKGLSQNRRQRGGQAHFAAKTPHDHRSVPDGSVIGTNSGPQSESLIALLRQPSSYPEQPTSVQVAETHISWVFLTNRYAYKLKKPVQFEFLDFSTPELRHQACLEELRLNRRLAEDVYLGVLPITQTADQSLELNGRGRPVDWVVQMRRLPAERALDVLLRGRKLRREEAGLIADHLARSYGRLLPKPVSPEHFLELLERHIRANGAALSNSMPADRPRIRRIQSSQLRFLKIQAEEFEKRVAAGRVVDGHGDLRPEHIYVEKTPAVIDCIEFSDDLREVDVADELSFLAMECERLANSELGELVLQTYEDVCGDEIPSRLLAFYRAYRACVRAKVAIFRSQQQVAAEHELSDRLVQQYLDLSDRYVKELGPPFLLIFGGLMGTGKSTLAAQFAAALDVDVLSTDHFRHQLLGTSRVPAAYGEGHYQPDLRERIYDELFRHAAEILKTGQSVVLDGTFLKDCLRAQAYDMAHKHGAVPLHVSCTCSRQVAYARIQLRADQGQSESEARTELYDLQARDFEPPCADDPSITVDTAQSLSHQTDAVCAALRDVLFD